MSNKRVLLVLGQSPFECVLDKQLHVLEAAASSGALLMQDAVYYATTDRGDVLTDQGVRLYALRQSLETRGVVDLVREGVEVVDYHRAVDLMMEEYDLVV